MNFPVGPAIKFGGKPAEFNGSLLQSFSLEHNYENYLSDDKSERIERLLASGSELYTTRNRKRKKRSLAAKQQPEVVEAQVSSSSPAPASSRAESIQQQQNKPLRWPDAEPEEEEPPDFSEPTSGHFRQQTRNRYSLPQQQQQHKNKKPVYVSINQQTVNGLLSLLLLFVIATFGCMGNIFIISALTVIESLQTRGNCFLVSLSLAHLLVNLLVIPSSAIQIMAGDGINSKSLCHFQWSLLEFSLIVSQFSFFLMAADNYLGFKLSEKVTTSSIELASRALLLQPAQSLASSDLLFSPLPVGGAAKGQQQQISSQATTTTTKDVLVSRRNSTNKTTLTSCEPSSGGGGPLMSKQSLANEQTPAGSGSLLSEQKEDLMVEGSCNFRQASWLKAFGAICCFVVDNAGKRAADGQVELFAGSGGGSGSGSGGSRRRLKYENLCGKFKVLVWIISVWLMAFLYTNHQQNFSYSSKFCSPTEHLKNVTPSGGSGSFRVKNVRSLGTKRHLTLGPGDNWQGGKLIKGDIGRREAEGAPANGFGGKQAAGSLDLEVNSSKISRPRRRRAAFGRKRSTLDLVRTKPELEEAGLFLLSSPSPSARSPSGGGPPVERPIDFRPAPNLAPPTGAEGVGLAGGLEANVLPAEDLNYLVDRAEPEMRAGRKSGPISGAQNKSGGNNSTGRYENKNNNNNNKDDDDDEESAVDNEKLVMAGGFGRELGADSCHRNKALACCQKAAAAATLPAKQLALRPLPVRVFEYKDKTGARDSGEINGPLPANCSSFFSVESKAKEGVIFPDSPSASKWDDAAGGSKQSANNPPVSIEKQKPNRQLDRWLILISPATTNSLSREASTTHLIRTLPAANKPKSGNHRLPGGTKLEPDGTRRHKLSVFHGQRLKGKFETFSSDASKLMNNNNEAHYNNNNNHPALMQIAEEAAFGPAGSGLASARPEVASEEQVSKSVESRQPGGRRRLSRRATKLNSYLGIPVNNANQPEATSTASNQLPSEGSGKFVSSEHQMVFNNSLSINATLPGGGGEPANWQSGKPSGNARQEVKRKLASLPPYYWPLFVSNLVLPSFASIIFFFRAYLNMKRFKLRQYSPIPSSLLADYPALASPSSTSGTANKPNLMVEREVTGSGCQQRMIKNPSPVPEEESRLEEEEEGRRDFSSESSGSPLPVQAKQDNQQQLRPALSASEVVNLATSPRPSLSNSLRLVDPTQKNGNFLAVDQSGSRRSASQPTGSSCFFPAEPEQSAVELASPEVVQQQQQVGQRLPPAPPATPQPSRVHRRLNQALSAPIGYEQFPFPVQQLQRAGLELLAYPNQLVEGARIKASSFNAHPGLGQQNYPSQYIRRDTSFSAPPSATFLRPRPGEPLFSLPPGPATAAGPDYIQQPAAGELAGSGASANNSASRQQQHFRRRNFHAQSFHYGCSLANIRSQQGSPLATGGSNPSAAASALFRAPGQNGLAGYAGQEALLPPPALHFHESEQQHLSPEALQTHQEHQQQQQHLLARHRSLPHSSKLQSIISPALEGANWQQQATRQQLQQRRRRRSAKKGPPEGTGSGEDLQAAGCSMEKLIKSSASVGEQQTGKIVNTIVPTLSKEDQSSELWAFPAKPPLPANETQTQQTSKQLANGQVAKKVTLCIYSHMTDDQLLKSNITVFLANLLLWLPFLSLSLASQFREHLSQELKDTVWWLSTLNCCTCSYIYAITNRDFREAFNKLFYYCCCKSHVTFQKRTPIFRRQLELDSKGNLRVHLIPGLNSYSSKLTSLGLNSNPSNGNVLIGAGAPSAPVAHQLGAHKPLPMHHHLVQQQTGRSHHQQVGFGGPLFVHQATSQADLQHQQQQHFKSQQQILARNRRKGMNTNTPNQL